LLATSSLLYFSVVFVCLLSSLFVEFVVVVVVVAVGVGVSSSIIVKRKKKPSQLLEVFRSKHF